MRMHTLLVSLTFAHMQGDKCIDQKWLVKSDQSLCAACTRRPPQQHAQAHFLSIQAYESSSRCTYVPEQDPVWALFYKYSLEHPHTSTTSKEPFITRKLSFPLKQSSQNHIPRRNSYPPTDNEEDSRSVRRILHSPHLFLYIFQHKR